jgi:hypothetical protein
MRDDTERLKFEPDVQVALFDARLVFEQDLVLSID